MKKKEIKEKLRECFKKCALGRARLRKCVNNAMNAGLAKEEVVAIAKELDRGGGQNESILCAVTAIGQALKYEEKHGKVKPNVLKDGKKEEIQTKLNECYKKCGLARRQLRKCVTNALNAGLTKEEVLALTDDIVGGLGKNEVSACAIVAVDQVLRHEESARKQPIDVVKERVFERGDA